jgi:hypothetical protein
MCDDFIGRGEVSGAHGRPPLPLNAFCHLPHPDKATTDDALGDAGNGDDSDGDGANGGGSDDSGRRSLRPPPSRPSLISLHSLASLRVRVLGKTTLLTTAPRVLVRGAEP